METNKNTDWIVFGMLQDPIGFEKSYDRILIKYLNKNPDNNEKDFLLLLNKDLSQILVESNKFNKDVNVKNDEDIRQEIIEDGLPPYENIEEWILAELEKRKEPKSTRKETDLLKLIKIKLDRLPKTKEIKPLLFKGKKFNISERFSITNSLFDVDIRIRKLNITDKDKSILLANILGCHEQTARELLNGTQQKRTPVNEDFVNEYLKTLT